MKTYFRYLIYFLLVILLADAQAQPFIADFNMKQEACRKENIIITNQSDAGVYEWDFCEGDLVLQPTINTLTNTELDVPFGTSLIQSNGKWYGFITSLKNNSLFRVDFGDVLLNTAPTVVNLGNLGGIMNAPQDIKVIEFENNYYAFINNRQGNKLIRINLGANIEATTATADVLVTGNGFTNGGLDLAFDGANWIVALTNDNHLTLINLKGAPNNTPYSSNIINTSVIPEANRIGDIKFVKDNAQWYGFAVSFGSKTIHRLAFGSSLFQDPTTTTLNTPSLTSLNPYGLVIEKDNNAWILLTNTIQGNFLRLNLGDNIDNDTPEYSDLGKLNGLKNTLKLDVIKSESRWIGLTTNWSSKEFFMLTFPPLDCPFNQTFSSRSDTIQLSASEAGSFNVSLRAKDASGLSSSVTRFINISEAEAPSIAIDNTVCLSDPIQFLSNTNQPLTSATWTINNETRTGETVTYDFSSPGTYEVTFEVESTNGCGNRLIKDVTVYEPPVSGFSFPAGQICTNGAVPFTNTTDARLADDIITYRWFVVDENSNEALVSVEASPALTFATGGEKTVRLEASIPGCTEVTQQTLTVLAGPTVGFTVTPACKGNPVTFINATVGSGITSYAWDFGDGNTFASVTPESPTHTFAALGDYPVTLTVTNALGCQNVYRQDVTVYSQPTVSFLSEVACAGSPTQFTDASTAGANANVSAWQWDFGDGIGTASTRNPTYAYRQAGTYAVKLITASTAGCVDSTVQTVTVQSAVDVGFAAVRQCPTEARPLNVLLSDTSVAAAGETIDRWFWTVNGENFVSDEVEYAFPAPGDYPVSLTVFTASGCNATVQRVVSVTTSPAVAFSSLGSCTGEPVVFQGAVDAPGWGELTYAWDVASPEGQQVGTATTANAEFTFDAPGTYAVTLTVQTDGGCTFSTTQPVTIAATPVAAFTPSASYGGTPLEVTFANATTNATTYAWDFGGVGTSEVAEPTFTFTEVGTYVVTLVATNAAGCASTTQHTVEVVLPVQDLQLDDFTVADSPAGDGQQLVLTISNRGTRVASGVAITVDLDETLTVEERRAEPLLPGQTVTYVTKFRLPTTQRNQQRPLRYLCARIAATDADFTEARLDNNRNCLSLNEQLNVEPPFPNPAREQLRVSVILPAAEAVSLRLVNQDGRVVRTHRQETTVAGLNTFLLDVKGLPVGAYVLQISYRDVQRQFRVAVGR